MTGTGGQSRTVADRHDAYRRGLCADCRVRPYSAGRPRCNECHTLYTTHDLGMGADINRRKDTP